MYRNNPLPSVPWYQDEAPRREKLPSAPILLPFISISYYSNKESAPFPTPEDDPTKLGPSSVPAHHDHQHQHLSPPTADPVVGKKRTLEGIHTDHVVQDKRPLIPSAVVPRPSLEEYTRFILQFVKVHNQGDSDKIMEMLTTRFHPRFERISYRIELPSRKIIENSKLQSFGPESYMEYLASVTKFVPDSVFSVGRPFIIKDCSEKPDVYMVQCNYSFRGTYLLMPDDDVARKILNLSGLVVSDTQTTTADLRVSPSDPLSKINDLVEEKALTSTSSSSSSFPITAPISTTAPSVTPSNSDEEEMDFLQLFDDDLTSLDFVSFERSDLFDEEKALSDSHNWDFYQSKVKQGQQSSVSIISVPFNLLGKFTLYVSKITQKIERIEYVYSS